jgi:arylsulfatase A-like enzyme
VKSQSADALRICSIACFAGVMAGGLHGAIIWFQRVVMGRLTFHSQDAIWMAPLGTAILFVGFALMAVFPAVVLRRRIPVPLAAGVFGALAVFTVLLPYSQITRWAAGLLAVGVGVHLARSARRTPERWTHRFTRVGLSSAAILVVLGVAQRLVITAGPMLRLRAMPDAPAGASNILLIILDTVRGESLSLYGYARTTSPRLEQWAARGVIFDNAIATAPWTLPSHGSLLTGEPSPRVGGGWLTPISASVPTLAEVLHDQGYRTAGFAANLLYASHEGGLPRGFAEYQDYPVSLEQVLLHSPIMQTGLVNALGDASSPREVLQVLRRLDLSTDQVPADDFVPATAVTDGFLRWQAEAGDRPFFAMLNYFNAHAPYRSSPEYQARFNLSGSPQDRYDAAIAFLDAELDRLFTVLESRGVLERSIVVVTSDHGELFGEHDLHGHADALYLPALRVPLVLMGPSGIPAGTRVAAPVSLRDIPATLLELSGSGASGALPGVSLAGQWDSARRTRPQSAAVSFVTSADDPQANSPNATTWLESITDDSHHYIRSGQDREELFRWRLDSLERNNIAESAEATEVIRRLRSRISAALRPARDSGYPREVSGPVTRGALRHRAPAPTGRED